MLLLRLLAELVAPSVCAACDAPVAPATLFCASCAAASDWTHDPTGVYAYGGSVADAVIRYKFRQRPDLAAAFARAMIPVSRAFDVDVVVPGPTASAPAFAERGY